MASRTPGKSSMELPGLTGPRPPASTPTFMGGFPGMWDSSSSVGANLGGYSGGPGMSFGNSEAVDLLRKAFDSGMNGSIRNFDTASARLRERVDAYGRAQEGSMADQWSGMGKSGGEGWMKQLQSLALDRGGMLAQGLTELEKQFEDARLQGLNQAINAASSMGGLIGQDRALATQSYDNAQNRELNRRSALDQILATASSDNARNALQWQLGLLDSSTRKDIAKQDSKNSGLNQIISRLMALFGR